MAFDDLPSRPEPLFPAAKAYADTVLQRSREVAESGIVRLSADVPFGESYYQRVDIYAPHAVTQPLPVLLFLHGGAFIGGYKEWMGFMAPAVVATPALFVSVSYRLAPEDPFPAPVEDTAAAIAWAWTNIARFGGDPARIFIGGHSAGGNLASIAALDRRWLARHDLPGDVIKGVIAVSAPLDMDYDENDPTVSSALAMRRALAPSDSDAAYVSPLALATEGAPPFYVSAGDRDLWQLARDTEVFRARLERLAVPVFAELYVNHDHFDTNTQCVDDGHPWIRRTQSFLRNGFPQSD